MIAPAEKIVLPSVVSPFDVKVMLLVALTVDITGVVELELDFDCPAETLPVGVMPVTLPTPTPTETPMLAPADLLLLEAWLDAHAPLISMLLAEIERILI